MSLTGKTVVVTRPRHQAASMQLLIEERGGRALLAPMIDFRPMADIRLLDEALANPDHYDSLLFTSSTGVRCFLERWQRCSEQREKWQQKTAAAVGPQTARALRRAGFSTYPLPRRFRQEELGEMLISYAAVNHEVGAKSDRGTKSDTETKQAAAKNITTKTKLLFPRAKVVRPHLLSVLHEAGVQVHDIPVYETHAVDKPYESLQKALAEGKVDAVTFTSGSTVIAFGKWLNKYCPGQAPGQVLHDVTVACIGPATAERARSRQFPVHVEADRQTGEGIIRALEEHWHF